MNNNTDQNWKMEPVQSGRWLVYRAAACLVLAVALAGQSYAAEKSNTSYDFYGFIQLDVIYDFNRMDPNWIDGGMASQA